MYHLIVILIFWSLTSVSFAEPSTNVNIAEMEMRSTVGIGNKVYPRYDQVSPEQNAPNEMPSDEEVQEPTTIEQDSPTRSRVVTRTTSRPSNMNNQQGGVDIGPVYVPIGTGNYGQSPGSTVILNPPQPRH